MKQGLLFAEKGKTIPFDYAEVYIFGYENRYGIKLERIVCGLFGGTKGADDGLFEVTLYGLASRPSEIRVLPANEMPELLERLDEKEIGEAIKLIEEALGYRVELDGNNSLQCVDPKECGKIVTALENMKERQAKKKVTSANLNNSIPYGINRDKG